MSIFVQCIKCEVDGWHITQMYKRSNVCRNCHAKMVQQQRLSAKQDRLNNIADNFIDRLITQGLDISKILELINSRIDTQHKP